MYPAHQQVIAISSPKLALTFLKQPALSQGNKSFRYLQLNAAKKYQSGMALTSSSISKMSLERCVVKAGNWNSPIAFYLTFCLGPTYLAGYAPIRLLIAGFT